MPKIILSGTNRPNSRTCQIAHILQDLYQQHGEKTEVVDLSQLPLDQLNGTLYGSDKLPAKIKKTIDKINRSEGLIIICPEYNGSMPGSLKYFIDFWNYPLSFEFRPVCFVGLGGRFGGLRPVEHLQQVFGYRNAFIYPIRVFLMNIWETLADQEIQDPVAAELLEEQVLGFQKFTAALKSAGLDANSQQTQGSSS